MKKHLLYIICLCTSAVAFAQEQETIVDEAYRNGMMPVSSYTADVPSYADSLHLPDMDYCGRIPRHSWYYPYLGYGLGGWELHQGMNVNVGLSAFTSFGKNSINGWSRNLSAVYATPLNDKLSFAVGGYVNSVSSNFGNYNNAALTAVLDYRFNEHWEAFVYAQKSLVDNNSMFYSPMMYPGMMYMNSPFYNGGDRVGGGLVYHASPDFTFQVQFDYTKMPDFHRSIQERWEHPDKK